MLWMDTRNQSEAITSRRSSRKQSVTPKDEHLPALMEPLHTAQRTPHCLPPVTAVRRAGNGICTCSLLTCGAGPVRTRLGHRHLLRLLTLTAVWAHLTEQGDTLRAVCTAGPSTSLQCFYGS
ncbi:hypothetical protein WMY93_008896 [Mugilogobius chulae]|uniref:Uncharacterized protein n=1 Tax=Mugilogobius chulae TaxID=88201 RepID=A0AAW0PA17_9GOBI